MPANPRLVHVDSYALAVGLGMCVAAPASITRTERMGAMMDELAEREQLDDLLQSLDDALATRVRAVYDTYNARSSAGDRPAAAQPHRPAGPVFPSGRDTPTSSGARARATHGSLADLLNAAMRVDPSARLLRFGDSRCFHCKHAGRAQCSH